MAGKPENTGADMKVRCARDEVADGHGGPMSIYAMPFGGMNQLAKRMEQADLKDLPHQIKSYAGMAVQSLGEMFEHGSKALIFAWACGTVLNAAKNKLQHGQFGQWRKEELGDSHVKERTAQRYMQLAARYANVEDLLAWRPSLRQAYVACGMLPEPPETMREANGDSDAVARQALVASVVSVQRKLRRFSSAKVSLDAKTKAELVSAKSEIDELFKILLG